MRTQLTGTGLDSDGRALSRLDQNWWSMGKWTDTPIHALLGSEHRTRSA